MILSDQEIKSEILSNKDFIRTTSSYNIISQVWPASIDLRLSTYFKLFNIKKWYLLDTKQEIKENIITLKNIESSGKIIISPWEFLLWSTIETIKLPTHLVARCEWRSSLGRLGLIIHSTAGFIDPWFQWTITLEIKNINSIPIVLYYWMRICQLAFEKIYWTVETPYNLRKSSKYMWQIYPEESRIYKDKIY